MYRKLSRSFLAVVRESCLEKDKKLLTYLLNKKQKKIVKLTRGLRAPATREKSRALVSFTDDVLKNTCKCTQP